MARARGQPPSRAVRRGDHLILVTLGTHGQAFTRAIDTLRELGLDEPVIVQHGATPPQSGCPSVRWIDHLPYAELVATMSRADVVVSHAGVGSIVTALRVGRRPVVMPRLADLGEHVDDHQRQLADRLAARGLVFVHRPGDSLADLIAVARNTADAPADARCGRLRQAVQAVASGSSGAPGPPGGPPGGPASSEPA